MLDIYGPQFTMIDAINHARQIWSTIHCDWYNQYLPGRKWFSCSTTTWCTMLHAWSRCTVGLFAGDFNILIYRSGLWWAFPSGRIMQWNICSDQTHKYLTVLLLYMDMELFICIFYLLEVFYMNAVIGMTWVSGFSWFNFDIYIFIIDHTQTCKGFWVLQSTSLGFLYNKSKSSKFCR